MGHGTLSENTYYRIKYMLCGIFKELSEDDISYLTNKKFVFELLEYLYNEYLKDQGLKSY